MPHNYPLLKFPQFKSFSLLKAPPDQDAPYWLNLGTKAAVTSFEQPDLLIQLCSFIWNWKQLLFMSSASRH